MLNRLPAALRAQQPSPDPLLTLFNPALLLGMLRRQWPLIAVAAICALGLALGYVLTAQSRYTATASIMIDTRKNQLFQSQQVVGELQLDSGAVESQAEILRSESVALAVIRDLKLTQADDFMGTGVTGALSALRSLVAGAEPPPSEFMLERQAVAIFERGLLVRRIGLTYVIEISFTANSPGRASTIANAIADAYMVGELDAKYQATRRASRWLQERMNELREQASVADAAVQQFKTENNIVDTGRGQLVSDQQLTDVNTQLINAKAATAEAKARLDRITQVATGDVPNASIADALRSEVITRLRAQYLDLAARESNWSQRYGANHLAAVNLRNNMAEIRSSIRDELKRIEQTFESDYQIAQARERSLEQSLGSLVGQAALTGQAQVKLRDLESSAQSYRNLYDNFLQRFMEATQQQTFPISEARILTPATDPLKTSAPRTNIILAGGLVFGLFFGLTLAVFREQMDKMLRGPGQAQEVTGLECLGILPLVDADKSSGVRSVDVARRTVNAEQSIARHTIDEPFSRFAETLRAVKVAIDLTNLSREVKVIGLASALPQEGKTTVCANLAHLIAGSGQRTLVIDGDLRNPSLTKLLVPEAEMGLVDVLAGRCPIGDVVWTETSTGLHIVPSGVKGRISHTADLISSQMMADLLAELRGRYDYVLLDLPPLIPVVDTKAAGHLIDGFVMVIEWGKTTTEAVTEAISAVDIVHSRGIGVVLNKANVSVLKRLETYKGRYYNSYYLENDAKRRG